VKAQRGTRGELDLAGIAAGALEHIDSAKLIEIATGKGTESVFELPRGEVQILSAYKRSNARALMPLLNLVPPAFALVQHHRRLFDEDARVPAH
jgi:hypothetical protein